MVLGEKPTDDINHSFGTAETKLIINFTKANKKFYWVYITMVMEIILMWKNQAFASLWSMTTHLGIKIVLKLFRERIKRF